MKMYNWEKSLEEIVFNERKQELKFIKRATILRSINLGIYFSAISCISLASFGGAWLLYKELSIANDIKLSDYRSRSSDLIEVLKPHEERLDKYPTVLTL